MKKQRKFGLSLNKKTVSNMQADYLKGGCPSGVCTGSCICGTAGCPPAPSAEGGCDKK